MTELALTVKKKRANNLTGKEWLQNSMSIWSNIKKEPEEFIKGHPASFPKALVRRLLECFAGDEDKVVLDPFMGTGTTVIEAEHQGKKGIGFDIYPKFMEITNRRLAQGDLLSHNGETLLVNDAAENVRNHLPEDSIDIVITSPPYWDILTQKRTADGKNTQTYGENKRDLGLIDDYNKFMLALCNIFEEISIVLKVNKYCIINVMDLRKGPKFFPVHSDLAIMLSSYGYELDEIIIWNRAHEYNSLRPLGYPTVFRINRIHEYLLVFKNRRMK